MKLITRYIYLQRNYAYCTVQNLYKLLTFTMFRTKQMFKEKPLFFRIESLYKSIDQFYIENSAVNQFPLNIWLGHTYPLEVIQSHILQW